MQKVTGRIAFRIWIISGGQTGVDVRLNGAALDPAGRYRVTVNSFLASGGDKFSVLPQGAAPARAAEEGRAIGAAWRGGVRCASREFSPWAGGPRRGKLPQPVDRRRECLCVAR
jgi:hypothetical protein